MTTSQADMIYIFGAGGFGREVAWLVSCGGQDPQQVRFVVDRPEFDSKEVNGIPVHLLGRDRLELRGRYLVAIGDPFERERAVKEMDGVGVLPAVAVHPNVQMSQRVTLGAGSIVCAGNIITTEVTLGRHVHVNLSCTIGHDVVIGDFVTLSPGVNVSGNVHIEDHAYIGTGASIINGSSGQPLIVGAGSVVAAGACVTRPVEPGALVAGVPAVRKR